jgi:polysaccharide export outer membrane protein
MYSWVRWWLLGLLVTLVGCAHAPYVWVYDLPEPVLTGASAAVAPGDRLYVFVRDQPTMSVEAVVAEDATIVVPIVGQVAVGGHGPDEIAAAIERGLAGVLQKPLVRVSLMSRHPTEVVVVGEVRSPGRFAVPDGTRLIEVIAQAGGLTEYARRKHVYVLRPGDRPLRIRFRYPELARGEVASSRFVLLDGDIVVAE